MANSYEPSTSNSRGRRRGSSAASIWSNQTVNQPRAQSETSLNKIGLRQRRNTYIIGRFPIEY